MTRHAANVREMTMIESWLQYTCDGCGATEFDPSPNVTRKECRGEMNRYGWVSVGRRDYCRACVKDGAHKGGESLFEAAAKPVQP